MSAWIIILLALAAVAVQAVARYGFGPRRPIGDEIEYLKRVRNRDPFCPSPFLRVPAMGLLCKLAGAGDTEARLRDLLALLSLATVAITTAAGFVAMGPAGGIAAALVYTLLPDRIILSQHIWPDALMALWQSLALLLIASSIHSAPVSPWLLGAVAAAATLTRIDGVVLVPALTAVAATVYEQVLPALLALCLPTAVALAVCTIWNARHYGIWLPDTTPMFNVGVLAEEHRQAASASVPAEVLVGAVNSRWQQASHDARVAIFRRDAAAVVRQPGRLIRGFVERICQMLGPNTFAIERLLDPVSGAYPQLPGALRITMVRSLRVGFPMIFALAVAGIFANALVWPCILPASAAFLAACLTHARTRFRHAILPSLSFAAAAGLLALVDRNSRLPPPSPWRAPSPCCSLRDAWKIHPADSRQECEHAGHHRCGAHICSARASSQWSAENPAA